MPIEDDFNKSCAKKMCDWIHVILFAIDDKNHYIVAQPCMLCLIWC